MPKIDLNAPTIPNESRVWRLFPGRGYKFLGHIIEQNAVCLDFPGLEFDAGKISGDKDINRKIVRSIKIREELVRNGPGHNPNVPLEELHAARKTKHRSVLRQAIINLYEEAKDGDYIVTPENLSQGRVWVGGFASNRVSNTRMRERYGDTPIPARRVRWFGPHPENTLSSKITKSLRSENPFTLLERGAFVEVFALAHGSFVYRDRHAATVYNDLDDFLDSDAAFLGTLSKFAAAALQAVEEGKEGLGGRSIIDVILRNAPIQYTCSQEADIHSPGFIRYTSGTAVALIIAAVAATMLNLSTTSTRPTLANDIAALTFVNSGDGADPLCTAKVSEATKRILDTFGVDRTWVMCHNARLAKERAGLRSSATPKQ